MSIPRFLSPYPYLFSSPSMYALVVSELSTKDLLRLFIVNQPPNRDNGLEFLVLQ